VGGMESTSFKEISSRRHKGTKCPKQLKKARGAWQTWWKIGGSGSCQ
jgi:hypothetical protein